MSSPSELAGRCAVCGKSRATQAYRPFCSKRCADVDLQRWLSNGYVVPGEPAAEGAAGIFDEDQDA